jgi:hypothetical protein
MPSKRNRRSSSLSAHKRQRKTLTPPLMRLPNLKPLDWPLREPNMLWLASLCHNHPGDWRAIERALEPLDEFVPEPETSVIDGRLTSFQLVPPDDRAAAREAALGSAAGLFGAPLGHSLMLFDDFPAGWLFEDWAAANPHDIGVGLRYLRTLLAEMVDSRSVFSAHVRMLSLGRYLAHGKVFFSETVKSVEVLGRYPTQVTADEAIPARQIAKVLYDSVLTAHEGEHEVEWGRRFWRECARLARPRHPAARGAWP